MAPAVAPPPPPPCIVPPVVQAPAVMALTAISNTTGHRPKATKSSKIRLARKGKENVPPKAISSVSPSAAPTFAGFSRAFASSVPSASSRCCAMDIEELEVDESADAMDTSTRPTEAARRRAYLWEWPRVSTVERMITHVLSDDGDVEMEELEEVEVEAGDVAPDYGVPLPTPVEDELAALFSGLSIIPSPEQLQFEADSLLNDIFMAAPLTHPPTATTSYRPSVSAEVPEVLVPEVVMGEAAPVARSLMEATEVHEARWGEGTGTRWKRVLDEKRSKRSIRYSAFAVHRMMLEEREREQQEAEERRRQEAEERKRQEAEERKRQEAEERKRQETEERKTHAAMNLIASYADKWQVLKAELWARLPSTKPSKVPYMYSGSYAVAPAQHNQCAPTIGVVRKREVDDDDTRHSKRLRLTLPSRPRSGRPIRMDSDRPHFALGRVRRSLAIWIGPVLKPSLFPLPPALCLVPTRVVFDSDLPRRPPSVEGGLTAAIAAWGTPRTAVAAAEPFEMRWLCLQCQYAGGSVAYDCLGDALGRICGCGGVSLISRRRASRVGTTTHLAIGGAFILGGGRRFGLGNFATRSIYPTTTIASGSGRYEYERLDELIPMAAHMKIKSLAWIRLDTTLALGYEMTSNMDLDLDWICDCDWIPLDLDWIYHHFFRLSLSLSLF
ncbi:hypothetical protein DXG01_005942 [Tephrocybe rancida]|nr:hypothetical protein DXG01_005942 [Tephrocybe rancida]